MIIKLLNKIKKNHKILFISFTLLLIAIISILGFTLSAIIEGNDVRVKPQSKLTYYIDVSYDGIDSDKNVSSDSQIANVSSGIINVEDKLPEGLTFKEFVTTSNGTIGAVYRNDKDKSCPGKVIDDGEEDTNNYHGLHYDPETRTVSFQVKGLKAGCVLTVGIKTTTPAIDDPLTPDEELRRDFYNFAVGSEEDLSLHSNTVHVWMGDDEVTLYDVTYAYDDSAPSNAPTPPASSSYAANTTVGVAGGPLVEGYTFNGWTTSDVVVNDGKFTMPTKDVKFVGSFTKQPPQQEYTVTYSIKGSIPEGYVLPLTKSYPAGQNVKIDSFAKGTVFNDYRFKGWKVENSDITVTEDNDFIMPTHNVTIVGEFELVTYIVEYQFTGAIIPPNPENYLPSTKSYRPGATVKLENVTSEPAGYKFLGWYEDDTFIMPEEDVIVYGEWKELAGTFSPTITKEIVDKKDFYRIGDTVTYAIKVTNTASFPIRDVIVKENNDKATFVSGTGYAVSSPHTVTITKIEANSSIDVKATYVVTEEDEGTIPNTVKIMGALADGNYELAPEGDYEASAEFNAYHPHLKICKQVDNVNTDKVFTFNITSDNGYEQDIRLKKDECQTIAVDPGKYQVLEVIPQEYELTRLEGGIISGNGEEFTIGNNGNYEITFVNTFKRQGFFHSSGEAVNKVIHKDLYSQIEKDFGQGSNVKSYEGEVTDEVGKTENANIYYYTTATHNNVIFADFCWQIVRTTATEGVKIVYNGVPTDGKCNNLGTAQQIGTSKFNTNYDSPAYVGYMYNTIYSSNGESPTSGAIFGNDVTYDGGQYTLTDTGTTKDDTHHYTCNSSSSDSCATVRYYYFYNSYIELTDGKKVEDALNEMLSNNDVNAKDSDIKIVIDTWYEENMTDYTQYLEDTVFCNDRIISSLGGWDPNGGSTSSYLEFNNYSSKSTHVCPNETDQFAMNNSKAQLTYPVGLLTVPEAYMMGWRFAETGVEYWLGSPFYFGNSDAAECIVGAGGALSSYSVGKYSFSFGVRPAVSLNPGTGISGGDGTKNNPYIVEPVTK